MKSTLEQFIDPANIPKKYGGQLDYEFGNLPNLDSAVTKVVQWEGDHKDFPNGPKYWVHKKGEPVMEAIAVGTVREKERKEKVCTVKKLLSEEMRAPMTRTATSGSNLPKPVLPAELLNVPTEPPTPTTSTTDLSQKEEYVVSGDDSFVSATQDLTLKENGTPITGPHTTATANMLDPAVNVGGGAKTESAHDHHEEETDVKVGGGAEEADNAHPK